MMELLKIYKTKIMLRILDINIACYCIMYFIMTYDKSLVHTIFLYVSKPNPQNRHRKTMKTDQFGSVFS